MSFALTMVMRLFILRLVSWLHGWAPLKLFNAHALQAFKMHVPLARSIQVLIKAFIYDCCLLLLSWELLSHILKLFNVLFHGLQLFESLVLGIILCSSFPRSKGIIDKWHDPLWIEHDSKALLSLLPWCWSAHIKVLSSNPDEGTLSLKRVAMMLHLWHLGDSCCWLCLRYTALAVASEVNDAEALAEDLLLMLHIKSTVTLLLLLLVFFFEEFLGFLLQNLS